LSGQGHLHKSSGDLKLIKPIFLFTVLSFHVVTAFGQIKSNARQKYFFVNNDTIILDTLSLLPASLSIYFPSGERFPDSLIVKIDEGESKIIFKTGFYPDSLLAVYRVFPILLTQTYRRKDRDIIEKYYSGQYNPFTYEDQSRGDNIFKMEGLQRNGNISRGISFGNNQDLVVNSSFNLQLAGKLSDDVEILAAITDNNIPVQPEGNTQQIQDFDKVFIQLSRNKSKLIVGDFELKRPDSYFMNFNKKGQGGVFSSEYSPWVDKSKVLRTTVSGAISKGKFARNVFMGIEANQGPYRLTGAENESFIVVLAGTEKIFIDGEQLTRGEDYDYVIDYNTAELSFTPRRPITKDKRIVAEFQYSDKNYSRTMFFANQEYETSKLKIKTNIFSEQDAKNQPLLQDLDADRKNLLAQVGDSITQAFYPNIDSVQFNSTEVLYARRESGGYVYYEYSTDSSEAYYRLGFSFVGIGFGNYIPVTASANGRVFQWVQPVNNIPQGSYEPVILLIAPKMQQMISLGADYKLSDKSKVFLEAAYSNYNINLFSKKDKSDDKGYAIAGGGEQIFKLGQDSIKSWNLLTSIRLEHVNDQFQQVETFRNVEFIRDWNLTNLNLAGDENLGTVSLSLIKPSQLLNYRINTFIKGKDYRGLINSLRTDILIKKFRLAGESSYLITDGTFNKTNFLRSKGDLSRPVGKVILGSGFEQERNQIYNPGSDSLQLNSFSYDKGIFYFSSVDTAQTKFRVEYSRRYDYQVRNNHFKRAAIADEGSGKIEFTGKPGNRLTITSSYRNLQVEDSIFASYKPEESLLNRIEYNFNALKGMINSLTFYEAGTGQELKREYVFVEVAPGTGVYTYAGDYNNNGVKDLDEFEISAFPDEANFIKVFLPSNEYIKTRTNQFNQVLTLNPSAFFQQPDKFEKFISRFSDQVSYRVDNKTLEKDLLKSLDPFRNVISDSILIATNSALRNTLSFNRNSNIFGMDFTYQENRNKILLTNGFETRVLRSYVNNLRWNLTRVLNLTINTDNGTKSNRSQFFSNRDYKILYYQLEPKFSIQPGISFRTTFIYEYSVKENKLGEINEKAEQHTAGIEIKYSSVKRGIITAKFNLIQIDYNAPENTPIAYEILEGLKKGRNYTWGLSVQRNLSNSIQLSLNYEGRKPEGTKMIHTGAVQARAFF